MSQAWHVTNKPKRGTGRTTRMLQEAIRLEKEEGRAVYVLAAHKIHAAMLRNMLIRLGGNPMTIKIETARDIRFDWETMRIRGTHPNCITLLDHYTIECKFWDLLNELHRFDA